MNYCSLLHNFKKNELSISAYLAKIKYICDSLVRCGQHIYLEEYQSAILNGLLLEYDHVVSIITTRTHLGLDIWARCIVGQQCKSVVGTSHTLSTIVAYVPSIVAIPFIVSDPAWYP
ncbi:hypothetical protein PVK06_044237 [Gossypium arboreum]|uniref:Uncharacterized protein n=1 Tax=Gossypium arboreum TaxID=29729 RepID=A0ABR0MQN3_GOSAR|nr:hypothetical protein PVK06_044237 [Gossypium arboreum]